MTSAVDPPVLSGAEPMSHVAGALLGVVAVHGFTGSPSSMRGIAEAVAAAGFDVELPRLPGHGTTVDEMLATGWFDWYGEVGRAIDAVTARCDRVVLVGQSMGATLVLAAALSHDPAGLVCINPATRLRDADTMAMLDELIDDGISVVPGEGSDIADPESSDIAYPGTPLRPLRSFLYSGVAPLDGRLGEIVAPLRLYTSRHDHVVDPADSEHLAATYGGDVDHVWLERSYHVATRDFDRQIVIDGTVDFVTRLAAP